MKGEILEFPFGRRAGAQQVLRRQAGALFPLVRVRPVKQDERARRGLGAERGAPTLDPLQLESRPRVRLTFDHPPVDGGLVDVVDADHGRPRVWHPRVPPSRCWGLAG